MPTTSIQQLVAWIDQHGNGKHPQHAHPSKTLLVVEAGHTIIHRRQQYVVTAMRPYRTSLCEDETSHPPWKRDRR